MTCICGREFNNIQAFRGHKSHCVKHLESTGRLSIRQKVDFENKERISKSIKAKFESDKKRAEEMWKNEKHLCEHCGIVMETKYGSGRFCSRTCSNSRKHSDETKNKIKKASIVAYQQGLYPQLSADSPNRQAASVMSKIHSEELKSKYLQNPSRCCICGKELSYERRNKQTCSVDCRDRLLSQKASAAAKRMGGNLNPYGVRGTAKYGTYKGIHCDSSWELAYVMYCLDHNVHVQRNNDGFEYTYKEEQHLYFPDFVVDGVYIEVKNFNNEQVQCKVSQFPKEKQLTVLFKQDMKKYINYCINTYGKNYAEMYDKDKPSWMDRKLYKEKKTA